MWIQPLRISLRGSVCNEFTATSMEEENIGLVATNDGILAI